jgi:hypothetical protein
MVDNLMFTKYEGNNCFYYTETTLIYFKIWIFWFVEDIKIISDIAVTIMQRTATIQFKTRLAVRGCRLGEHLLSPLHYICLCCPPGCFPHQHIFRRIIEIVILFIIRKIAWPHHFTKSLSPRHVIEVHGPWQGSERPCVCALVESMLHVSTMISLLTFGTE